jgi:glycosyltransferase involved in cell wall biosynthesis
MRAKLGAAPGTAVILVAARLEPVKGHRFLLDVLDELRRRTSASFLCACAGEGEEQPGLEVRTRELALEDRVRFLGFVEDLPTLLAASDVVALSSEKEGIPRIAMEAMAAKRPVVATNVMGTRETVAHGVTGLLSPPGDVVAMARNLAFLVERPWARHLMGAAGPARVRRFFDDRRVVDRMLRAYEALMPSR